MKISIKKVTGYQTEALLKITGNTLGHLNEEADICGDKEMLHDGMSVKVNFPQRSCFEVDISTDH